MGAAEGATALDAWPRVRQSRFALRRNRLRPGPLKPVGGHRRRPAWAVCIGLLGLSLVTTWALAAQLRTGVAAVEQPASAAEPVQEAAQPVRIVGTAPAPQTAPPGEASPAIEAPPTSPVANLSAEPQPASSVMAAPAASTPKREPAPSVDLGALPVLTLDETAFDTVQAPASENTPDVAARAVGRP
ncbi:hypothetical protein [Methylorubrum aminovorans]